MQRPGLFPRLVSRVLGPRCRVGAPWRGIGASTVVPHHAEIAIVGGGIMGMSTAYWLARRMDPEKIVVVEQDATYQLASTPRSVGSIRQQFSIPENVLLSKFGAEFLETISDHLAVPGDDDPVDVSFRRGGYMFLASVDGLDTLRDNHAVQRACGAAVDMLTPADVAARFPWMRTDDLAGASLGTANEGWFDPWLLLSAFRRRVAAAGVRVLPATATAMHVSPDGRVSGLGLRAARDPHTANNTLSCRSVVLAAGPWSGALAAASGLSLPVEPRLRHVFVIQCPDGPVDCPMVIDTSGAYVRPEGRPGQFVCGASPEAGDPDPAHWGPEMDTDDTAFMERVWPALAHRAEAFEEARLVNFWSGLYEYNTLDQNGIVGRYPGVDGLFVATGFSGHGIQQGPAVGRAVSELVLDGEFSTIDLTRFGVERLHAGQPLKERNVV